jgi:CubicO group peptidase (beta-lactamase class C family)
MMKLICALLLFGIFFQTLSKAQTLYFPPLSGSAWDATQPESLNWCQARVDSLYNYLQLKNTKSFIILKNGKIVLEKYFGTYTSDSIFYWASTSKSLSAFITGIAQQKNLININNSVSQYLGVGWSSETPQKENLIKVKNLLQMNSGLEDNPPAPCDNEDSAKACLIYKVDAGTRWAYHTGAYKKVQSVVSVAAGQNYNLVTNNWVKTKTGMTGLWIDQTFYSKARDMARFGLLILNKGVWNTDTVLKDQVYFNEMINSSQSFNPSYGYLWWLNGKSTYLNPGLQFPINGPLIPNAPNDMFCALGKNDQKIYVVPSTGVVIVRQGNSAGGVTFALSNFDNKLWDYINKLNCSANVSVPEKAESSTFNIYPNPSFDHIKIESNIAIKAIYFRNLFGQEFKLIQRGNELDVSFLEKGIYTIGVLFENGQTKTNKVVIR